MSNIAEYLQKILSARYGKDVRQSIHDAIKEVDVVADTAQNSATKAAEAARESEQASSLNAQEAEAFRNEAEQFRNEAALFTPDNYAEFVQTAAETKERVDVLEENMETISSGVETLGENFETISSEVEILEGNLGKVSSNVENLEENLEEVSSEVETNKNNIEKVSFKVDTVIEKADLRIKETVSGESIHLTDSADAKVVEFGLYGKATQKTTTGSQLLNYDAWKTVGTYGGTSIFENNGVTITSKESYAYTHYGNSVFPQNARIPVSEGDTITLSWEESSNKSGGVYIFPNAGNDGSAFIDNKNGKSLNYTATSGITFVTFRFGVATAGDTISYKNIMINKGTSRLPYEPYTGGVPSPNPEYPQDVEVVGSSGNVVVKSYGKNLLNLLNGKSGTNSGVTMTNRGDGSYSAIGTATHQIANIWFWGTWNVEPKDDNSNVLLTLQKGKTYVIKDCCLFRGQNYYRSGIHTINEDFKVTGVRCEEVENGKTYNEIIYPIIYESDVDDGKWEPYKDTSSTIQTPNGLAGTDVKSGGNYTDKNGQQWICDGIVKYADGSGEYIQNIWNEKITSVSRIDSSGKLAQLNTGNIPLDYNSETNFINILYTHGVCRTLEDARNSEYAICQVDNILFIRNAYIEQSISAYNNWISSNDVKIAYALATPIRTPLTAEQIAEIEKLYTFYPVTNIFNDADCGMKTTYIVDAKKYIDNKIAELATAMVNNI